MKLLATFSSLSASELPGIFHRQAEPQSHSTFLWSTGCPKNLGLHGSRAGKYGGDWYLISGVYRSLNQSGCKWEKASSKPDESYREHTTRGVQKRNWPHDMMEYGHIDLFISSLLLLSVLFPFPSLSHSTAASYHVLPSFSPYNMFLPWPWMGPENIGEGTVG